MGTHSAAPQNVEIFCLRRTFQSPHNLDIWVSMNSQIWSNSKFFNCNAVDRQIWTGIGTVTMKLTLAEVGCSAWSICLAKICYRHVKRNWNMNEQHNAGGNFCFSVLKHSKIDSFSPECSCHGWLGGWVVKFLAPRSIRVSRVHPCLADMLDIVG